MQPKQIIKLALNLTRLIPENDWKVLFEFLKGLTLNKL